MIIRVRNTDYFDWEIPEELLDGKTSLTENQAQALINEHFDPDSTAVEEGSDPYYEYEGIVTC